MRTFGWRLRYAPLPGPRGVIVVYPHTSNWDFPIGLLASWTLNLPIRWIGKDTLFTGVFGKMFGPLLRRWGGRPVFRSQSTGLVGQLAGMMRAEPWCWLAITPEGTRSRREAWRSGFYHLAREVGVPVGVAYIDYPAKELGLASYVDLTGDAGADLARIAALLSGHHGRHPEKESPIRFREEAD